jgi:MinD-like ATPase involved in chromosome partitioning or flagellar assembly
VAEHEQDWPADPGSAEPPVTPAAASAEDPASGHARSAPARARSVWADMLISGPDDAAEPEPDDAGQPPPYGSLHEGPLGWPSSGLPPSFGQRPAAGERPDFGDPAPPLAGPSYGRHRPVPPPQPGPAHLGQPPAGSPEFSPAEPGPAGYGFVAPPAPDAPQPGARERPEGAFGPWETYEAEAGHEWTGGYGEAGGQNQAVAQPGTHGGYGYVPPGGAADSGEYEPLVGYAGGLAGNHGAAAGIAEDDYEAGLDDDEAGLDDGADGYGEYDVAPPASEAPQRYQEPGWETASADSLTADVLLPGRHSAPPPGWRRALYTVTGGLVRAPQSAADRRRMDLVLRARTPVAAGHHRVAVLSMKGGVGKTTTAVGLGSTLASLRGDRIIAVDANPDRGTLCDKLRLETAATVRDLLNEEGQIRRYADVRAYTTQAPSGLEVLASDRDPTVSVAFSDQDYEDVAQVLEHYYSVCITDCGTGLLHSAVAGVLRLSDQIVLVSSPSVDGARSASATLDWLAAHHYGDLVRGAVVILSAVRPRSKSTVDLARLEQHFAARCRAVVRIPYDAHLEEGAEVDLAQLSRATSDAYLILAAEVGDGFAWPRR